MMLHGTSAYPTTSTGILSKYNYNSLKHGGNYTYFDVHTPRFLITHYTVSNMCPSKRKVTLQEKVIIGIIDRKQERMMVRRE